MSLGYYKLIKGNLVVMQRQSPDGDSMRFIADNMALFSDLPRYSEPSIANDTESYQLRFQAIDTPELHYGGASQPHGRESRNGLLTWLGVEATTWDWDVAPKDFMWSKRAEILTDGFEGHGRPVAFVLLKSGLEDGAETKLTTELLQKTYNYHAVNTGLAYVGLYSGGLPLNTKTSLIAAYKAAKSAQKGIWALDRTNQFAVTTLDDLGPEQGALVYPKIFRRCVDALKWAGGAFEPGTDLDDFLALKPSEDDKFIVHIPQGGRIKSRLSEALEQVNNQIKIQVDLNTVEFVSK